MSISYTYEENAVNNSDSYIDTIDQIERLRETLNIQTLQLDKQLSQYVYDSTAIEGNQLRPMEITKILKDDITIRGRSFKDFSQANNCADTLHVFSDIVTQKIDLTMSEEFICYLHSLITSNELSTQESECYRTESVSIRFTDYIPPNEYDVPMYMQELVRMYLRPLNLWETQFERICEFKRNFERIHPFIDGNGRTGRMLMNIEFLKNGYGYINIPYDERDLYFEALENNTLCEFLSSKMLSSMLDIKRRYYESED